MIRKEQWDAFVDHPVVEWGMFILGIVLMLLSPLAGVLPGPGGIIVFAVGLTLVLRTSMWAKRRYVRLKRKQPKIGRWTDWGMRRKSALRREAIRREQARDPHRPGGPIASSVSGPPRQPPEVTGPGE